MHSSPRNMFGLRKIIGEDDGLVGGNLGGVGFPGQASFLNCANIRISLKSKLGISFLFFLNVLVSSQYLFRYLCQTFTFFG